MIFEERQLRKKTHTYTNSTRQLNNYLMLEVFGGAYIAIKSQDMVIASVMHILALGLVWRAMVCVRACTDTEQLTRVCTPLYCVRVCVQWKTVDEDTIMICSIWKAATYAVTGYMVRDKVSTV